jgi:non-heme chloroperoxidase
MAKDIVMIHGANEGGWCFDQFKAVFAGFGWTCPAPDLIGHGLNADKNGSALVGVGIADYLNELETFLASSLCRCCSVTPRARCLPNNVRPKASCVR